MTSRRQWKLPKSSYKWALRHLEKEGDGDLFPPMPEVDAFKFAWRRLEPALASLDVMDYVWQGGRRFVVPKRGLSFRVATQLHPIDSLVLGALLKKYGEKIERSRIDESQEVVFSNRFRPTDRGLMYHTEGSWQRFWNRSLVLAQEATCQWVAVADITDFYNQIYHHAVENELLGSGVPAPIVRVFTSFMGTLTDKVSRGIAVGPHATHLLAECSLNPVDRSLSAQGHSFVRFVDDFHFFCQSRDHAYGSLHALAESLDKHQRLTIQSEKTRILPVAEFLELSKRMLRRTPMGGVAEVLGEVIREHEESQAVLELDEDEREAIEMIDEQDLESLLDDCLSGGSEDLGRLQWLLRGLGQVGSPKAVGFVVGNIGEMLPILADASKYLIRVTRSATSLSPDVGRLILNAMSTPQVKQSDYLSAILLDLFARCPELNHTDKLIQSYSGAGSAARREIVWAVGGAQQGYWLKERKADFQGEDPWVRSAFVGVSNALPGDEPRFWLRSVRDRLVPLEKVMAVHAFRDRNLGVGDIRLARQTR